MKRFAPHAASLVTAIHLVVATSSAEGQIAGAPPAVSDAGPPAQATSAAPAPKPAPVVVRHAPKPLATQAPAPAPLPPSTPAIEPNETATSTPAPAKIVAACIPDCRSGFVCREGECVSACNPACGENEICSAKRECVVRTETNDPYPYDKVRFGIGGHAGIASAADGTGTPFGGHAAVAIPLGGRFFTREDVVVSYFRTTTNANAQSARVDQTYLLAALRATAGFQLASAFSARAGALVGTHVLTTNHGSCGIGAQERTNTSLAVGGTGALSFAMKHADLSLVVDAYSANTQHLCGVVVGPFNVPQGAQMVPQKQLAAEFLAQDTILF